MKSLKIGNKREMFWDDYLVDTAKTTAFGRMIPAMRCGNVFDINKPWSARSISYPCIIKDEKGYKMYYFTYSDIPAEHRWRKAFLALLESPDGYTWDYSKQSLVEFEEELMVLRNLSKTMIIEESRKCVNNACQREKKLL